MKMKSISVCVVGLLFFSCKGLDRDALESLREEGQAPEFEESNEDFFGNDLTDYEESDGDGETADQAELPEPIVQLKALHRQLMIDGAKCAGFEDEAIAFFEKRDELREQGLSKKEMKEALEEEQSALKDAKKENRDKLRECRDEFEASDNLEDIRTIVKACWEEPAHGEARRSRRGKSGLWGKIKGKKEKGMRGKRGKKKRRGLHKLPPKDRAQFDSEECQTLISSIEQEAEPEADAEGEAVDDDSTTEQEVAE